MMSAGWKSTLGAALLALSTVAGANGHAEDAPMRALKAVRSVSSVEARDAPSLEPRKDVQLGYSHDDSSFAATLHIGIVTPTIVLEELDGLLTSVRCSSEGLFLNFASDEHAQSAQGAWQSPYLVVITSHVGCNSHGERVPYLVSGKSFTNKAAHLVAAPISWAKIADRMSLSFETTGNGLSKRDSPSSGGSHDINWSLIDQTIWTQDGITQICKDCSGSATVSIMAGNIDLIGEFTGVANGALQVASAVGVEANSIGGIVASAVTSEVAVITSIVAPILSSIIAPIESAIPSVIQAIPSVIQAVPSDIESVLNPVATLLSGFPHIHFAARDESLKSRDSAADIFKLVASDLNIQIGIDNLQAKFEFETQVQLSNQFTFHLLGQTGASLPGFEIPNIIRVGPSIDPTIVVNFEMQEPVTFDYGFDMTLPSNATLDIDFLNPANSSAVGFDELNVKPGKVTIENDSATLNFSTSFRPIIEFGIYALSVEVDPIVVFVDLPQVNGSISFLENVDDSCQPINGGSNHISYEHSLEIDVGIGADISAFYLINANPQVTLASKTNLFPFTTCINYGAKTAAPSVGTGLPYSSVSGMPGPYSNATLTKVAPSAPTTAFIRATTVSGIPHGYPNGTATTNGTATITSAPTVPLTTGLPGGNGTGNGFELEYPDFLGPFSGLLSKAAALESKLASEAEALRSSLAGDIGAIKSALP